MNTLFSEVKKTVDTLTEPNKKLQITHNIYQSITQLEQIQKEKTLRNSNRQYTSYFRGTMEIHQSLDTLKNLIEDKRQKELVDSMQVLLYKRDKMLLNYLKQRASLINNKNFSLQLNELTNLVNLSAEMIDSNVKTTQLKTTTILESDSVKGKPNKRNWIDKLFGRNKSDETPQQLKRTVNEEVNIIIDTLTIANQDSIINQIENQIQNIASVQQKNQINYLKKEYELINNSITISNQLLNLLHDIENEELELTSKNNLSATSVVAGGLRNINYILIVFSLLVLLLLGLIFIDISKSNKYRIALLQSKEEAEYLGQVKERFLANMSHEIRTPLQSIIGFSEQAMDSGNNDNETIKMIHYSSQHLLQIVNEVLDYSKITSGKYQFTNTAFNLASVIDNIAINIHNMASKKGLAFEVINLVDEKYTWVSGDDFRLRQVLFNLLGNAIKYTEKGSVTLEIGTTLHKNGSIVFVFKVTDTGVGIPQKDIHTIFHKFEQAGNTAHQPQNGTGLGLSIAKEIVEAQNGSIEVKSETGKGSIFTVSIPYRIIDPSEQPSVSPSKKDTFNSVFSAKIIVVDDDELIRKLVGVILEKHRIPFRLYSSAEDLLKNPWDKDVTLMFLDIRMPGIQGTELAKIIKANNSLIKIVALTAQTTPLERENILSAGFDAILLKPFKEEDFLNYIKYNSENTEPGSVMSESNPLAYLAQMSGYDNNTAKELLTLFVEATKEDIDKLKNAGSDIVVIREIVHRLSGRVGQLGAIELSRKLNAFEQVLIYENQTSDVKTTLTDIINELEGLCHWATNTYLK